MLPQLHHLASPARSRLLAAAFAALAVTLPPAANAGESPRPERVAARDAWRVAEALTASKPDYDIVIGRGGSMLPLYPDGTVLVLRRLPVGELQQGMTVVFIGDTGRPVAHTLMQKTWRGWVAKGLNNAEADHTLVQSRNYLGAVVRAFTPVIGESNLTELAGGGQ